MSGPTLIRGTAALSAVLLMLVCCASAQVWLNAAINNSLIDLTINGLPEAYPGGSIYLESSFFADDCSYTVNDGASMECDPDNNLVRIPFTAQTWSSAPVKVTLDLPVAFIASRVNVRVGTNNPVLMSTVPTSSEMNSRMSALASNTNTQIDMFAFGIFPSTPLREQTPEDLAATSRNQTILIRFPPAYTDVRSLSCGVFLMPTEQLDIINLPDEHWNTVPTNNTITSDLIGIIQANYRNFDAEWRADALIPMVLTISASTPKPLGDPSRLGAAALGGDFEVFISRGSAFERFTFGNQASLNVVAPSTFARIAPVVIAYHPVQFSLAVTLKTPYDPVTVRESLKESVSTDVFVDLQSGTAIFLLPSTQSRTYQLAYFFPQSLYDALLQASSSKFVRDSARSVVVPGGAWACFNSTGSLTGCNAEPQTVCGRPSGQSAVCVDAYSQKLPSVSCVGQERPVAAEAFTTEACGYWACKAVGGTTYTVCGEQHLSPCSSNTDCMASTTPRVWASGSEPTCFSSTGTLPASSSDTCPEAIVPKPAPSGSCSRVGGCNIFCVDKTQPFSDTQAFLVPCESPEAWTTTCRDATPLPETRRAYCTNSEEVSSGSASNLPRAVVDDSLCKSYGTLATERACVSCAGSTWVPRVTLGANNYSVDDVVQSGSPTVAQLTAGQTCQPAFLLAALAPQKSPELHCTCDSDLAIQTLMSAADPGSTQCGSSAFSNAAVTAPCPTGAAIDYMCGSPLASCAYSQGSGSGAGFDMGASNCPTDACGIVTVLRTPVCAVSYGAGNANTTAVTINADACADKVKPTATADCPPVRTTCAAVPESQCAEVNLATGALFAGAQTCDASLPGLPRAYATSSRCVDPAKNATVSAALCTTAPTGADQNGKMYQFSNVLTACYLPPCALAAREFRYTTTQGECSTETGGISCRSWRTQTLVCETREKGNTNHGWEEVLVDLCRSAGITAPANFQPVVQCPAPATSPCGSGSTCALYPIMSSGVTYAGLRGVCTCPGGKVGANCSVTPEMSDAEISMYGRDYFYSYYELSQTTPFASVPAVTAKLVRSAGGVETVVATVVQPVTANNGWFMHFLPESLKAGTYTLRYFIRDVQMIVTDSFVIESACTGKCGANGTCNDSTELCECQRGFAGALCDTDLCANARCSANIQECVVNADNTAATCVCAGTWTGPFCQYNDAACESASTPSCRPGGHREAVYGSPAPTCGDCDCSDLFEGDTCATCSLTCSVNGVLAPSTCRACVCLPGYGGPECADRANYVRFAVDTRGAALSPWFSTAAAAAGGFAAQPAFRTWVNAVEDALMSFLDEKLGYLDLSLSSFSALAAKTRGSFVSFVSAHRGTSAADSHLIAVLFTLTAFDRPPVNPSVPTLLALVQEFALRATSTVGGATTALKDAFTAGSVGGSSAVASIDFTLGLGVNDPLCTANCPQGVGALGILPSEAAGDGSSGLSDGEIAAIVVCSVVGGLLIIGLIVAAATGSCCFKKGSARDTASVSPRNHGTTGGDVELHTAGRAEV